MSLELAATTPVDAFTVSVAGIHGVIASERFEGRRLPGSVFVRVAAQGGVFRVVARSEQPSLGASSRVDVAASEQKSVRLTMSAPTVDVDDDGWPDAVDVCPTVANTEQVDSDGDGVGDDCASSDAGVTPCGQRSGLLSCADFEDAGADLAHFGEATATVETGAAAAGSHFLRISRPKGLNTYSGQYVNLSGDEAHLFIRLFVQFAAQHPSEITLIEPQHTLTNTGLVIGLTTDAGVISGVSIYNRIRSARVDVAAAMSVERWHCVEVELLQGDAGVLNAWVDDRALEGVSSGGPFDFNRTFVGATYNVGEGGPVLIDEVASSSTRIGCK